MSDETPTTDEATALGAALRTTLEGLSGGIATAVREAVTEGNAALLEEVRQLRPAAVTVVTAAETPLTDAERQMLPGGQSRAASATDGITDVYDMYWNDPSRTADQNFRARRANLELARMVMGGTEKLRINPWVTNPSERFMAAYRHHVFEMPARDPERYGQRIMVEVGRYEDGTPKLRAMDTAESGNGLELVGAQFETELWAASRASDPLLSLIREIPMRFPTDTIPVDGALPELRLLGESTTSGASAYTESDTPSTKATLTAKKFGINQLWSGELDEDSIIRYADFSECS